VLADITQGSLIRIILSTMPTVEERNLETELRDAAAERGITVTHRGNGHFQINGPLLVNWYPFSKRRTAYVQCTTRGVHHATIAQAIAMAFEAPPIATADRKVQRGNQTRYARWRARMWKKGFRSCHWCSGPMNRIHQHPKQATVDHKIPLDRGGLDNPNNWVMAHAVCNHTRGHDMPELGEKRP
jgi:5-methylcytosine-specific restriction endonuclease McrA